MLIAASCGPAFQCPWNTTPPPDHRLNVQWFPQNDTDYCVPASILMWLQYVTGYTDEPMSYENYIWDYAAGHG